MAKAKQQIVENRQTTDGVVQQWHKVRPDLDARPMAVCGDVWRTSERIRQKVLANAARFGLDMPRFDVLLTLRRQGEGKSLSPKMLAAEMMLSTSAMTNRLDRLEQAGHIQRTADPEDRRGLKIQLTQAGQDLVDEIVESHLEVEEALLKNLSQTERDTLRDLLNKIG